MEKEFSKKSLFEIFELLNNKTRKTYKINSSKKNILTVLFALSLAYITAFKLNPEVFSANDILGQFLFKQFIFWAPWLLIFIVLKAGFDYIEDERHPFSSNFTFKDSESLEANIFETINHNEARVTDNKNWLKQVDKSLTKNIFIIFDNIDRLPDEKIRSFWSVIHSHFSVADEKGKGFEKIFTIVPFSKEQIARIFHKELSFSTDVSDDNNKNEQIKIQLQEYLNKTFQIIYEVPVPSNIGWRVYFEKKFSEKFGKENKTNLHNLQEIFKCFSKVEIYTPRHINQFINDLHVQ